MANDLSEPIPGEEDDLMPRRRLAEDMEMDITPMIDMTFLLLIFFLVTNTMAQSGAELPLARYGTSVNNAEAVIVTIRATGPGQKPDYFLATKTGDEKLSAEPDVLEARVQQAMEEGAPAGKKYLVIKADGEVKAGDINRVAAVVLNVEGYLLHYATKETENFE
jgi:biopolymer transport protein ExbD